jgi:hypothetical protein
MAVGVLSTRRFRGARLSALGKVINNDTQVTINTWNAAAPTYDTDGFVKSDGTGFLIPAHLAGVYRVTCQMAADIAALTDARMVAQIFVPGLGTRGTGRGHFEGRATFLQTCSVLAVAEFLADGGEDGITANFYQDSGAAVNLGIAEELTFFALEYLGRRPT